MLITSSTNWQQIKKRQRISVGLRRSNVSLTLHLNKKKVATQRPHLVVLQVLFKPVGAIRLAPLGQWLHDWPSALGLLCLTTNKNSAAQMAKYALTQQLLN
jgi:hypothetical protein